MNQNNMRVKDARSLQRSRSSRDYSELVLKYAKPILGIVGIAGLLGVAYLAYRSFANAREQKAQIALVTYLQEYHQAVTNPADVDWQQLAMTFKSGADRFSNSLLAPYFTVLHADALARAHHTDQSLVALQQAVNRLDANNPITALFEIKQALMLTDQDTQDDVERGLARLQQLAFDENNTYRDMALFYLGRYYSAHNDMQKAKEFWTDLVAQFYENQPTPSPWAAEAKPLLDQLT